MWRDHVTARSSLTAKMRWPLLHRKCVMIVFGIAACMVVTSPTGNEVRNTGVPARLPAAWQQDRRGAGKSRMAGAQERYAHTSDCIFRMWCMMPATHGRRKQMWRDKRLSHFATPCGSPLHPPLTHQDISQGRELSTLVCYNWVVGA